MKTVRIGLLFDSESKNTGDEAMGIAMKQAFAHNKELILEVVSPFLQDYSDYDYVIVGGGQLLRKKGDEYYDNFRLRGKNVILHAIGLLGEVDDLAYLVEYAAVSARTKRETAVLKSGNKQSKTVPCMTTLLNHDGLGVDKVRFGTNRKIDKVVGIHIVPNTLERVPGIIDVINAIPDKKVFIPFTHYNNDKNFMESLPLDMTHAEVLDNLSPLELHAAIGKMDYIIASSLHATIFAYSQNIPFATLGQEKVKDYFGDRGLGSYVFESDRQLEAIIENVRTKGADYRSLIEEDKRVLSNVIEQYEQIFRGASYSTLPKRRVTRREGNDLEHTIEGLKLNLDIKDQVICARDVLIGRLAAVNQAQMSESKVHRENSIRLAHSALVAIHEHDAVLNSKSFRMGNAVLHPWKLPALFVGVLDSFSKSLADRFRWLMDTRDSEAIYRKELSELRPKRSSETAVVLHLHYVDMWEYFFDKISRINFNYDLYVTIPFDSGPSVEEKVRRASPGARIVRVPNRGRDVLPFIMLLEHLQLTNYKHILKIHSKKSKHFGGGKDWLDGMMSNLLPNDQHLMNEITSALDSEQPTIVGPSPQYTSMAVNFVQNKDRILNQLELVSGEQAAERLRVHIIEYGFFAGTMFWMNGAAIDCYRAPKWGIDDFEVEKGQVDGTLAHAAERLFSILVQQHDGNVYGVTSVDGIKRLDQGEAVVPPWSELSRLI